MEVGTEVVTSIVLPDAQPTTPGGEREQPADGTAARPRRRPAAVAVAAAAVAGGGRG